MSGHNVPLIPHHYVWIRGAPLGLPNDVRGIWVGLSSAPGRALGCHVLLENGALLADLPLHRIAWQEPAVWATHVSEVQVWDCFGWRCEVVTFPALELRVELLDEKHARTDIVGDYWFSLDFLGDGYSLEPEQHKLFHVIASTEGWLRLLPTDRLLWHDASFTTIDQVPPIRRQTESHSVE